MRAPASRTPDSSNRPGDGAPSADVVTATDDGLGRVVRVVEPNGATTVLTPSMFQTKATNPDGQTRESTLDVDGRVITTRSYEDLAQQHAIDTTYHYGPFDRVDHLTDAKGHVTTLGYDGLGRRTYLNDPNMGPANASGEVQQGASQPTYESFTIDLVHDPLGRLDEVHYPEVPGRGRFVLKQAYDVATGELVRRDDATDPAAPSMLWQLDARAVDGALTHARYGAGATDVALVRTYDPATGRLEHIDMRPAGAANAAHALSYGYGPLRPSAWEESANGTAGARDPSSPRRWR